MFRLRLFVGIAACAVLLLGIVNFNRWESFEGRLSLYQRDQFVLVLGNHCQTEGQLLEDCCRAFAGLKGPGPIQDEEAVLKSESDRLKIAADKLPAYLADAYCEKPTGVCRLTITALRDVQLAHQIQRGTTFVPAKVGAEPSRLSKNSWRYLSFVGLALLAFAVVGPRKRK